MRYAIISLALMFLAGCASTGLTEEGEKAYFKAQREAASEPIMSISCPDSGCAFSSLTVNNPGNNEVRRLPVSSPAVEVTKALLNTATSVAPWAAVGHIAVEGIQNASGDRSTVVRDSNNSTDASDHSMTVRDSGNTTTTETSRVTEDNDTSRIREDNDTSTTRERGDTFGNGASVVGRDSVGDNSGQQSGNSGRIDSPDSDSTSTPTVVDQPEPTVVTQPDPVVVQPQSGSQ